MNIVSVPGGTATMRKCLRLLVVTQWTQNFSQSCRIGLQVAKTSKRNYASWQACHVKMRKTFVVTKLSFGLRKQNSYWQKEIAHLGYPV